MYLLTKIYIFLSFGYVTRNTSVDLDINAISYCGKHLHTQKKFSSFAECTDVVSGTIPSKIFHIVYTIYTLYT